MSQKISKKTKNDLNFIEKLKEEGFLEWPIDFEANSPSAENLESTLNYWFGSERWQDEGDKLIQFGQDCTGSLFCFWFYPGLKNDPPVVFLGSEGETHMVADNSTDFLKQLTSGMLFDDGNWAYPEEEDKDGVDWKKLKALATEHLGKFDGSPDALAKVALENHPHFKEWAESKIDI